MFELVTSQNTSLIVDQRPRIRIKDESEWATKDEERNEVGQQLTVLKKRHDLSKNLLNKREEELQTLEHEFGQLSAIEATAESRHKRLVEMIQEKEEEIKRTKELQEKARDERYIYEHVLERMKKTKIHLEMKSHEFDDDLKNKQIVVNEQLQRMRKSQGNSFLARQAVEVARHLFSKEEKQHEDQAMELERNMRNRREMASRREDRVVRQAEIAEQAANEQQDPEETRLRQGYLLHKFWWHALQRKLEKDKAQSVEIEEAFQSIKTATGLSDVREIVEKFLTKEQAYSHLVQAVTETEQRVERLKQAIESEQQDIRHFEVSEHKFNEVSDAKELDQQIMQELKEVQSAQDKLQKHVVVYDHIAEWVRKVYSQLYRIQYKDQPSLPEHSDDSDNYLLMMFQKLTTLVEELLEPIRANRDDVVKKVDDHEARKIDDIFQQSPDSLKKVVRVRPVIYEDDPEIPESHTKFLHSDEDLNGIHHSDQEIEADLHEQRRRIKQYSLERQESARKKKLKEKKGEKVEGKK